jgi:hypothetical protein
MPMWLAVYNVRNVGIGRKMPTTDQVPISIEKQSGQTKEPACQQAGSFVFSKSVTVGKSKGQVFLP